MSTISPNDTYYHHQDYALIKNNTISSEKIRIISKLAKGQFGHFLNYSLSKLINSEKATKVCEIFTLLLTTVHTVKRKVKVRWFSQNFMAFSEYMNFIIFSPIANFDDQSLSHSRGPDYAHYITNSSATLLPNFRLSYGPVFSVFYVLGPKKKAARPTFCERYLHNLNGFWLQDF